MADQNCPTCGAPCTTDIEPRGGDYGWGTNDKERTTYSYASPPVAVQEEGDAKDGARYREFFASGLPITFLGVEYRTKAELDAAIDAVKGDQP